MNNYFSYIMASGRNGTLYVGMTNDIVRRVYEHKNKLVDGFSKKYFVTNLVYYRVHSTAEEAIIGEKILKRCLRREKITIIEELNPYWKDLYKSLL